MIKLNFTIKLKSDAEIATGFGSSLLDAIVPRNVDGCFIIPASHIKGLIKQSLLDVADLLPETVKVAAVKMTGKAGEGVDVNGLISISDAMANRKDAVVISRTALDESGTAQKGSLRTTEAVPAGTEFKGYANIDVPENSGYPLLLKLALLSIMEIGGSRSRGCGSCIVQIDGEARNPGDLLLESISANYDFTPERKATNLDGSSQKQIFIRLDLTTDGPICVPETPVVGNNTITSGWTIPASAVQGMLLTRMNSVSPDIATACFESPLFRAWPLLPLPKEYKGAIPVRASASHKISKLADGKGNFTFCDEKIEKYDWKNAAPNAPIKSADGVLISNGTEVVLWRSGDMARYLSAHGVINGESRTERTRRNLFTVESIAETHWTGFAVMPETAFQVLKTALESNNSVQVGKSRSVRGNGSLSISQLDSLPIELPQSEKNHETVAAFIVQSPILLPPDTDSSISAAQMLANVVESAGLGKVKECSASTQILFGWNRNKQGRQKAELVIAPGSVFVLEKAPENWKEIMLNGIGEGRERGYGAILPHPGIASSRYRREDGMLETAKVTNDYASEAWKLWQESKKSKLSASQISRLLTLTSAGAQSALDFLTRQREDRSTKFWECWKPVFDEVNKLISSNTEKAKKVFKVWYNLTVATTGEGK